MKRQTKFGIVLAAAAVISVSVASLVCARGWVQQGADWYYADGNNEFVTETIQSSGNSKFYLDSEGRMVRDYFLEDYNSNTYYFGSNGAMVTNTWVAIDASLVENQGDYVPDNYWYYFQSSGKAMKGTSTSPKKTTIDGKKYLFNENGQMCTGWVKESGEVIAEDENPFKEAMYYAGGDNDGVLRAGWVTYYDGYTAEDSYQTEYTNLYFYFSTSNNKKEASDNGPGTVKTKKINGRTYAFNDEGIMVSGWDAWEQDAARFTSGAAYFSGQDDGHQVKKGWVYAVPSGSIDNEAKDDDEEKYMYFNNSGVIVKDQFRKINGKYYVFDAKGIMKTGLIIWCQKGKDGGAKSKWVGKVDLDWAEGAHLAKAGLIRTKENVWTKLNTDGYVIDSDLTDLEPGVDQIKLHFFGEDGARKTGLNTVEFSDDSYTLNTVGGSGDKGTGVFSKKYYTLGVLLKASPDIRFGIYQTATKSMLKAQKDVYSYALDHNKYKVLNTGGSLQSGSATAKKDADGNYWMIDKTSKTLMGIYTQNVKYGSGSFTTSKYTYTGPRTKPSTMTTEEIVAAHYDIFDSNYATINSDLRGVVWDCKYADEGTTTSVAFSTKDSIVTGWLQSEYGDSASKWIPFGIKDNSKNTATFNHIDCAGIASATAYDVKPNNDYFVNCYYDKLVTTWADDSNDALSTTADFN